MIANFSLDKKISRTSNQFFQTGKVPCDMAGGCKSVKLYLKNNQKQKKSGDMGQMVEHSFSKCKALSSIPQY
jgi:hypothetical protein